MTRPMTGSGIMEDVEFKVLPTDNGDHDMFSHYAHKDDITRAMVTGEHIMALCGKVWVPTRDGERFPVCPECKEIYGQLPQ